MRDTEDPVDTQLPIVVLDGRRAAALAELGAVTADLQFVMNCCRRLVALMADPEPDGTVMEALFTAALITYFRCFNSGMRFSLSHNHLSGLGLEGDPAGFHRQMLDMRNKHVAHSVNAFEMVNVGAVLSPEHAAERRVEAIAVLNGRHIAFDADGVRQLHEVCKRLINHVIAPKAERLQEAVLAEARQVPINDLYERQALRAQPPGPEAAGIPRA